MKKYYGVLKSCPLFAGFEESGLFSMLACLGARVTEFGKRENIISEGDAAKYVGIMLSGSAQIMRMDWFGNRSIVGSVAPPQIFGESFACAGVEAMPVDVVASEKCEVMLIDNMRITHPCDNACDFHRQLIYNLMKVMAMKNLAFHQKIEVMSRRTTREKLLAYLAFEAKRAGGRCFEIPYDRQALADYLEVDRSGLSAEISKLRNEGVLGSRKNNFKLL